MLSSMCHSVSTPLCRAEGPAPMRAAHEWEKNNTKELFTHQHECKILRIMEFLILRGAISEPQLGVLPQLDHEPKVLRAVVFSLKGT